MAQIIKRAHCAVLRPDHFKFASYGPVHEDIKGSMIAMQILVIYHYEGGIVGHLTLSNGASAESLCKVKLRETSK